VRNRSQRDRSRLGNSPQRFAGPRSYCKLCASLRKESGRGKREKMLFVIAYGLYAEVQPFTLSTSVNLLNGQIVEIIKIVKIVKVVEIVENYKTADRDKFPE